MGRAGNETHVYHSTWSNRTGMKSEFFNRKCDQKKKIMKVWELSSSSEKPTLPFSIICMADSRESSQ